jgi:hypothetical protein
MSETHGNKDIATLGAATRFGAEKGPDPVEAAQKAQPWSIRNSIRRFGLMNLDELKEAYKDPRTKSNELVAIRKFMKAMAGDVKAMQQLEESVDGKLVETKVEVRADSYADLLQQAEEARRNGIKPE